MATSIQKANTKQSLKLFFTCLFFAIVSCTYYWYFLGTPLMGIDDANIYFTYAKNFSEGAGFVYNVGGERVEGFTSLIWVLICSLFYSLSNTTFNLFLLIINLLLAACSMFLCLRMFIKWNNLDRHLLRFSKLFFLSLFIIIPGFMEWNVLSLMETGLWSFLLILIFYQLQNWISHPKKSLYYLIFLMPLLIISRPESIVWILAITGMMLVTSLLKGETLKSSFIAPSLVFLSGAISLITLISWRINYFGFPFPNTYYAKVSDDLIYNLKEGFQYLAWLLLRIRISVPVIILLLPSLWLAGQQLKRQIATKTQILQIILILFISTGLVIPILSGGDHFFWSRFYQPILPLMLLFLSHYKFWEQFISIRTILPQIRYNKLIIGLSIWMFTYTALTPLPYYNAGVEEFTLKYEFDFVENYKEKASSLESFFSELNSLPYIGAEATGAIGFYYNGKVLDLYGLNDVAMAHASRKKHGIKNHASFNIGVFLRKTPDLFRFRFHTLIPKGIEIGNRKSFDPLNELFQNENFKNTYSLSIIEKEGLKEKLVCYASNQFIEKLKEKKQYKIKTFAIQ